MPVPIEELLRSLDAREIAQAVGNEHDNARLQYRLEKNTVDSFDEFETLLGDYYSHHFTKTVSRGGELNHFESVGRAKEILTQRLRREGGNLTSAFEDARDGSNGGMRKLLDLIADHLKDESQERYIQSVFDRYITPNDFEEKVNIIQELIRYYGRGLPDSFQTDRPERYATNYIELIRAIVERNNAVSQRMRNY